MAASGFYAGIKPLALAPYVGLRALPTFPPTWPWPSQPVISVAVLAGGPARLLAKPRAAAAETADKTALRAGACWRRRTLLATPYTLFYDTPLLVLVLAPLLVRIWRTGWDARQAWS